MQIPILNGIYTDKNADFRSSYPVNLIPVPKQQGISNGYLRPAYGIKEFSTGPGICRGSINWDGVLYAVMGTKLVSIASDGTATTLGDVGGSGLVTMTYSFDYLAIASGTNMFLYDKTTLTQITDPDLGNVFDAIWIDGYFMATDGEYLVVTELNDPFSVDPLKYGSSEVNPDPVKGLLKVSNEAYAINRYTIEVFDNVGGSNFPFQRIESAQVDKGAIGTHCKAVYLNSIVFLGGAEKEAPSIWIAINGAADKVATREVDEILQGYNEEQLSLVRFEIINDKAHEHLFVHLPDKCLVYDFAASKAVGEPVWFCLSTSLTGEGQYRAICPCWAYDKWIVFDPSSEKIGYYVDDSSHHWGEVVGWSFGTDIIYNNGDGAVIYDLELVCLTGRIELGREPRISTEFSLDGMEWSNPFFIKAGNTGQRLKRLVWFGQGEMRHWRAQRFKGTSDAFISPVRLEANIEGLAY